ncbi:13578_t:CDS:2 [Racocetra persica]|uniref:13578_t:CDS:1 n=1 Tax=Racocetra persica TaxID=160502 RepID=A0ACA9MBS5_9GLOM|nr:13578_t:CDS:2 [Racocetra persica]
MAKRRRKRRTHVPQADESANPEAPKVQKSFVFKSGKVGKSVAALVKDIRKVMEPNTAIRLKERKRNRLKDFVSIAGPLGVTQFLIFTRTDNGTNFRLTRTPRGPTLCFKVLKYSLIGDVLSSQLNPKNLGTEYNCSPLIQLSEARRVVLFNYNSDTKHIDFRHYNIDIKPVGLSKSVRRIVSTNVPNLHKYNDISEYVLREDHFSESEAERGVEATVTLAQNFVGKNNRKSDKRAVKLREIGPRMELLLVKIQAGLFHKTPKEIKRIQHEREQRKQLAALRRKEQEKNVEKKQAKKEAHRFITSGGKKGKLVKEQKEQTPGDSQSDSEDLDVSGDSQNDSEDDENDSENDSEDDDNDDLDDEFSDIESEYDNMNGYSRGVEKGLFKVDDDEKDLFKDDEDDDEDNDVNLKVNEKPKKNERQKRKFDSLKGKPKFSMKIGTNKRLAGQR